MFHGAGGILRAADEAGDFLRAARFVEGAHGGAGALPHLRLFHHEMTVGKGGDLRQMGDAQHLPLAGDHRHLLAHGLRHAAGDAGVDLVKDHRADAVFVGGDGLERQHHAGNLAAGGDGVEGLERLAGVRGDAHLHAVAAGGGDLFRLHGDLKAGLAHAEVGEVLEDAGGEPCGDGPARLGERGAILPQGGVHALELLFPLGNAGLAAAQGFLARLQFLAIGDDIGKFGAVAAFEAVDEVEAGVELF